jgi:NAD(P)-dependent dehydrogenase (short-subunit alcohol dehydrogenase family)
MSEPQVAIVSGAGQGIGKAIAKRLLERGLKVVIADVDDEAGRETADEYRALGDIRYVRCDVADEAQVRHLIDETISHYKRIDALVNNAGIGRFKPLEETTLADWNAVIGVNLTGAFLCARQAAPHLRAARGAIVNIASTRALMSEPGTTAYSASKGGVVALTHSLAASLGPDVRVNCISPGWIEVGDWKKRSARAAPKHSERDRSQHPVGRVGAPDDVAALVEYLISPAAGFITGANFVVDGGMTRKMIYAE